MYCVKCGRRASEGEKRCPACGMRLVTPARLNRLLDEDKAHRCQNSRNKKNNYRVKTDYLRKARKCLEIVKTEALRLWLLIIEKLSEIKPICLQKIQKCRKVFRKLIRKAKRKIKKIKKRKQNQYTDTYSAHPTKIQRHKTNIRREMHKQSFAERNLRTIVAMSLLGLTVLIVLMWGLVSAPGMRTFASLGMGSAKGYVLLGDDYMNSGNYFRAVESYYTALNKNSSFEAAFKLARAYSYTGDSEKCVSALLYCTDSYPGRREPYVQLVRMYPDKNSRPQQISDAIAKGNSQFGLE